MNLIGAILVLFMSVSVLAEDYDIVRFEASGYQSFTLEEMKEKLGASSELLPQLSCNGRDEFDPFHPPIRINPLRNSLRIKASGSDVFFTYQLGRVFDQEGVEVQSFKDPFLKKVVKALKRFELIPVAETVLRHLEESYFPLMIVKGKNSFNPQVEGQRFWSGIKQSQAIAFLSTLRMSPGGFFADIGVGGQIFWAPDLEIDSIEDDNIRRNLDPDIALAHETYHAFDSIRGLLDMGMVSGKNYAFETVVEYRGVYFENLIRKALGIRYRKYYGDPFGENPQDLLTETGEPISIPATCL